MKYAPDKAASIAQCKSNIFAVIAYHKLPPVTILTAQTDRITAAVAADFREEIERLSTPTSEGAPVAFATWTFGIKAHHDGSAATTAVRGWREACALCSLQVIEHSTGAWEFDIDLCSPEQGLAPAIGHLFEVLKNALTKGKTDPFVVAARLKKRGVIIP